MRSKTQYLCNTRELKVENDKINAIFCLLANFLFIYTTYAKRDNFNVLKPEQLGIFFATVSLTEELYNLIKEVCDLVPYRDDKIAIKFYYCLAKTNLNVEMLNNTNDHERVRELYESTKHLEEKHSEKKEHLEEIIEWDSVIAQSCVQFNELKRYFENNYPSICSKMEVNLEKYLTQKQNLQSCSTMARSF